MGYILGQTWHDMKKLEKWGTFVTSVTHDHSENLRWKNFHIFIMIWQVYHTKFMNGSQCFQREKIWQSLGKNYKFYVIQRCYYSLFFIIPLLFKLALLLHKFIIKFWNLTFLVFSFRAKFGPRYLTNLFIFCNKIF